MFSWFLYGFYGVMFEEILRDVFWYLVLCSLPAPLLSIRVCIDITRVWQFGYPAISSSGHRGTAPCSVTCTTNVLPRYHLLISGPSCIVSSIYSGFWPADQMLQPELEINWIFNQFVQISLVLMASCLMDRNTDVMPILITDVPKLASSVCLYR